MSVDREASDNELWGYSLGLKLSPDSLTLMPSLSYKIAEQVRLVANMQIDSDYSCKMAVGAEYDFSQETKVAVQFSESYENDL